PEHLALAELLLRLRQEQEERLPDGLVVDVAIRLEPVARVVRLDAGEPLECRRRPSPERRNGAHRRSTQSSHPRTPAVWVFAGGAGYARAAACIAWTSNFGGSGPHEPERECVSSPLAFW